MNDPVKPQTPSIAGGQVALDVASARRTEAVVQYVERMHRGGAPLPGRGMSNWSVPATIAETTSNILAASGKTYKSGSAVIQKDNGTALSNDTGNTITVYNLTEKPIKSGSLVLVSWALGKWWIGVVDKCSNLT